MKLTGITGTGSGKMGSAVFSVSAGQQVVRQYQPVVANPSTQQQVDNRAKLKLLSQLSAVMADVIAIPRNGALTPRNIFVKENYHLASAVNGVASVNLADLAITKGGMQIPNVVAERVEGTSVSIALAMKADQLVSRVVYIMFYRNSQGELQLIDSAVVETAGNDGTFPYNFPYQERDVVVYAYGIFDKNAKATAKFGNYEVTDGTQVASLIADRVVNENDYLLTKTRGYLLAGETHIEINTIVCNGIPVAATGQTSVAYDESVAVEVSAVDVEGKVLAAVVDGQLGEMRAFRADGTTFVGAFNLVGGEVIRVQIGHMVGDTFVPEFTYGGTIVVGAQNSQFTSVTAGGVNIAASGQTQIQENTQIECFVNATGVIGKYMRMSVNGTAQTPVQFSSGEAYANIFNASVGDVITFQIGRMVNGTFVQDIAFGGQAVIAEVPATFTSVAVNGTAIPATSSTTIVLQSPNTIVVGTQDASGKYLGILNGNNQVLSVHAISGNTTTIQQTYNDGDIIKFAIGTGSDTSSFVAQTNYGGSVTFTATAPSVFSNVVVGSQNFDHNLDSVDYANLHVSGDVAIASTQGTHAVLYNGTEGAPAAGSQQRITSGAFEITSGSFSGNANLAGSTTYYLCLANVVSEKTYEVVEVYPYNFTTTPEW